MLKTIQELIINLEEAANRVAETSQNQTKDMKDAIDTLSKFSRRIGLMEKEIGKPKFEEGKYYELTSKDNEKTVGYYYKNPDANCCGFGFNTADGGGWISENGVIYDSVEQLILVHKSQNMSYSAGYDNGYNARKTEERVIPPPIVIEELVLSKGEKVWFLFFFTLLFGSMVFEIVTHT